MKKNDLFALLFMMGVGLSVVLFPYRIINNQLAWIGFHFGIGDFGLVTKNFPYMMGFLKVGILATFGEMLKNRLKTKEYALPTIWLRFLVWGGYGMLFTIVFALFANGIQELSQINLWFNLTIDAQSSFSNKLAYAFSTSFWLNLVFSYPMMLSHEWMNQMIAQKRFVSGSTFIKTLDYNMWGSFIPKTILMFWIPAHTVTCMLPKDFRVLSAALLSIALGFILSMKPAISLELNRSYKANMPNIN